MMNIVKYIFLASYAWNENMESFQFFKQNNPKTLMGKCNFFSFLKSMFLLFERVFFVKEYLLNQERSFSLV